MGIASEKEVRGEPSLVHSLLGRCPAAKHLINISSSSQDYFHSQLETITYGFYREYFGTTTSSGYKLCKHLYSSHDSLKIAQRAYYFGVFINSTHCHSQKCTGFSCMVSIIQPLTLIDYSFSPDIDVNQINKF